VESKIVTLSGVTGTEKSARFRILKTSARNCTFKFCGVLGIDSDGELLGELQKNSLATGFHAAITYFETQYERISRLADVPNPPSTPYVALSGTIPLVWKPSKIVPASWSRLRAVPEISSALV
jgi:hypothetical protein